MRVLIVEDNTDLAGAIGAAVLRSGATADVFGTAQEADAAWEQAAYSVIVLDLMLPDGSGLALLRAARRRGRDEPVLILTALDGVADRIQGLDAGADDYLVKPFDTNELLARLRALSRRAGLAIVNELTIGSITLDLERHVARCGEKPIALSRSEILALECLARNSDRICSKERIANAIYAFDDEWTDGAIEQHIYRLRAKMTKIADAPRIFTLRGLGYLLKTTGDEA